MPLRFGFTAAVPDDETDGNIAQDTRMIDSKVLADVLSGLRYRVSVVSTTS